MNIRKFSQGILVINSKNAIKQVEEIYEDPYHEEFKQKIDQISKLID